MDDWILKRFDRTSLILVLIQVRLILQSVACFISFIYPQLLRLNTENFILEICIFILSVLCIASYYLKKKTFIYMYFISATLDVIYVFFIGNDLYFASTLLVETVFVIYLICSKYVAVRFCYHTPFNSIALKAFETITKLSPKYNELINELEIAHQKYQLGELTTEQFIKYKDDIISKI